MQLCILMVQKLMLLVSISIREGGDVVNESGWCFITSLVWVDIRNSFEDITCKWEHGFKTYLGMLNSSSFVGN